MELPKGPFPAKLSFGDKAGTPGDLDLDLLVQGMSAKVRIELLLLHQLGLELLVARSYVTGGWLALLTSFSTFENHSFPCHNIART